MNPKKRSQHFVPRHYLSGFRLICMWDVPVVSDVRRFRSEEARREELSKETRAERAHRKAQIKRDSLQPF